MKHLPIGLQSIEDIITQGFTYVDKTGILYDLVKIKGYYFLSRPRRFGKSLTCSTLEAIFQGRKELFEGLAISQTNYDWKKYPVIRFDFSGIDHETPTELRVAILELINEMAEQNQVIIKSKLLKSAFRQLVIELANKFGPVVIIIDEYDKPILDHINNKEMSTKIRDLLKSFYGVLKDKEVDANLRFLFITGVSKFSKVSIFSEMNNLKDLTMDERTATLCGYTQTELESVFAEHIQAFAVRTNKSKAEMLAELKNWYNGFQFSKNGPKVYNPFSILNSLQDKDFANYWFSSGTPTFIMKFIENNPEKVKTLIMLEAQKLAASELESFSFESYFENMIVLFLQAGYLTISDYNRDSNNYSLCYPNYEIRLSMTEQILKFIAHVELAQFGGFIDRLRKSLLNDDINAFCVAMKDFFVLIPHTVIINLEKYYQGIFFTITKLIGAKIIVEDATNIGFIDAVLEGKNNIYVIEFKRGKTPDEALKQIEDKEYFKKFEIDGEGLSSDVSVVATSATRAKSETTQGRRRKPIVLVGINFDYNDNDKNNKGVTLNWKIKEKI